MITIPGEPISKKRHRSLLRHGHIASYDPQQKLKHTITNFLKIHAQPLGTPQDTYKVNIAFHTKFPHAKCIRDRTLMYWLARGTTKRDLDNLAKFYLDAANGVLWPDDKQIVSLKTTKCYSEQPRTEITVTKNEKAVLDETALAILDLFTPSKCDKAFQIFEQLYLAIRDLKKYPEEPRAPRATATAMLLNQIAHLCGSDLAKISKKHPQDWMKEYEI